MMIAMGGLVFVIYTSAKHYLNFVCFVIFQCNLLLQWVGSSSSGFNSCIFKPGLDCIIIFLLLIFTRSISEKTNKYEEGQH
jgi:hypothetical protein